MHTIDDPDDALAVLLDPGFVVPPVPAATHGVAWLRASVGRFSAGAAHTRRRALSESLLSTVDPAALRAAAASSPHAHPVQHLCTALGLDSSPRTTDAVRAVAAAYQPGTGDEPAADAAVQVLVAACGGTADETTAARIGLLVQACDATATLIARARTAVLAAAVLDAAVLDVGGLEVAGLDTAGRDIAELDTADVDVAGMGVAGVGAVDLDVAEVGVAGVGTAGLDAVGPDSVNLDVADPGVAGPDAVELGAGRLGAAVLDAVLRAAPPVAATKRMATHASDIGAAHVAPGEVVRISLRGIPFGAGPRGCPGRAHALALAEGALGVPAEFPHGGSAVTRQSSGAAGVGGVSGRE